MLSRRATPTKSPLATSVLAFSPAPTGALTKLAARRNLFALHKTYAVGHAVLLQIMPKSEIQTAQDREAVDREVKILKMVSPPNDNIVTMYGVFEDEENVYLLLELCTGGELFERLADMGTFSEVPRSLPPKTSHFLPGQPIRCHLRNQLLSAPWR